MKNNYSKEIIIFLLLVILIMLMMAVVLYDFIPSNITIPKAIEYTSDSKTTSIKQEIAYTNGGDLTADDGFLNNNLSSLRSYSIDAADLDMYGEKNLYDRGKSNPFAYGEQDSSESNATSSAGTSNNTNASDTSSVTTNDSTTNATNAEAPKNNTSQGTFFESSNSK